MASVLLLGGLLGCGTPAQEPTSSSTSGSEPAATPSATSAPSQDPEAGRAEAAPDAPAVPVALAVPSLGLSEELIDLGITEGGSLEVPEDPDRVGWFTGGGRPGGVGPTVIVGHVDSTDGPAVFARLPELRPGDEVVVDSADGVRTTYVVDEARDVPQQPFPTEEVFGVTPEDTLRLITCTGPYDREVGRYTENRIVTATPRT